MVDRVDKPDAPNPYAVPSATETKKDKPKEERRQEDLPTYQQKEDEEKRALYEEKFSSSATVLKTLRVSLNRIDRLLFRRALSYRGSPTIEADLVWKDGRTTEKILFLLKSWQEFFKIQKLKSGDEISPPFWKHHPTYLEISVRQRGHTSGSWRMQQQQPSKETAKIVSTQRSETSWQRFYRRLGFWDEKSKRVRKTTLLLYGLGILIITIYLMILSLGF